MLGLCFKDNSLLTLLLIVSSFICYSQNTGDFNVKDTICKNEPVQLSNLTQNAEMYEWDFCSGDLSNSNLIVTNKTFTGLSTPVGSSLIQKDGHWYGFVTNITNNTIMRIAFGTSLHNENPVITNLGNYGGLLSGPQNIKAIVHDGQYYLFVSNRTNNKFIRINLGTDITSVSPTSTVLLTGSGDIQNNGISVVDDAGTWYAIYTSQNTFRKLLLGSSPGNEVESETISSTILGVNNIGDITFTKSQGVWYGFVVGYTSKTIHRLNFGSTLSGNFNSSTNITTLDISAYTPYGVRVTLEGGKYYAFISTANGNLLRLDFAENIGGAFTFNLLGTYGILNNTFKFDIGTSNSEWLIMSTNWQQNRIFLLKFPNACSVVNAISQKENPTTSYSQSGTYPITLTAYDELGNSSSITKQITVTNNEAPQGTIAISDAYCISNEISFEFETEDAIANYEWNFGDENTNPAPNPNHQYNLADSYNVSLSVTTPEGCSNSFNKQVEIFDEAVPVFNTENNEYCSFETISFENQTTGDYGENISYTWNFNDEGSSTEINPQYTFETTGTKSITLTANVLGCVNTTEQTITINPGPNPDFEVNNICLGEAAEFTNLTQSPVPIDSYLWTFEEDETSLEENPDYQYTTSGNKTVRLEANASNGCSTNTEKSLMVGAIPTVDFEISQACQNQIINFTPIASVDGSAVSSYLWSFGDENNSTSDRVFPEFAYNNAQNYNASLRVVSEQNCENEITKPIDVLLAPQIGMEITAGCLGSFVSIQSTAASLNSLNVIDYRFEVRNSNNQIVASGTNNILNFAPIQSGVYTVFHRITTSNLCTKTMTQSFEMLPTPQVSLSAFATCVGDELVLEANTSLFGDEIVTWNWQIFSLGNFTDEKPIVTFSQTGQYWVQLNVTTARGCNRSASSIITVVNQPNANFASTIVQPGNPLIINFTNQSTGATQYEWRINDELLSNEASPSIILENVGNNQITLIARNNLACADTFSRSYEVPEILLELALDNIELLSDDNDNKVVLTISNQGSVNVSNYRINVDMGDEFSFFETINLTLPAYTINTVELNTQYTNNRNTSIPYICAEIVSIAPSMAEANVLNNKTCLTLKENYQVLDPVPNPVRSNFTHSIISDRDLGNIEYSITNHQGAMFGNYFMQVNKGLSRVNVDVSEYSAGAYFITTYIQGKTITKRFVVY